MSPFLTPNSFGVFRSHMNVAFGNDAALFELQDFAIERVDDFNRRAAFDIARFANRGGDLSRCGHRCR
jgi:hypothetical protein